MVEGRGARLATRSRTRSACTAGGIRGHDRPARRDARACRLLSPARTHPGDQANAAHDADQTRLVEPGTAHAARRAERTRRREARAGAGAVTPPFTWR